MIAVTGANGLLGSFIVRKLIETQRPFVALRRKDSDTKLLQDVNNNITWRIADVLDAVALEDALQGVTQVIHAAAMVSFNPFYERKIMDVNVLGTRNVVNACLANGVKRFVHISSVAALGRQKGQKLLDEKNKWIDSPLNSTYAKSKYYGELEVFRAQEEGLSTVTVNPSVILAPADWNKSSAQLFKYVWDERKFYIDNHLNYVDVRDVVDTTLKLLDSPVENERFILNGGNVSLFDFFSMIGERLHKKPPSIKLNPGLLKIVAFTESIRAKLAGVEPLITKETARLAGTQFSYSSEKISKTLNFSFQTIDQTLSWCCSYYLNYLNKK
jgi:nucleoside-diphosphate-sugar epimerase